MRVAPIVRDPKYTDRRVYIRKRARKGLSCGLNLTPGILGQHILGGHKRGLSHFDWQGDHIPPAAIWEREV